MPTFHECLPWLYILSRGCASGMNVSLRVERHRAALGNIPGFHLVRPTVSRGGTQDTVISPSSLLLLVYIQIFRENRERKRLRWNPSKFPFVFPKSLLISPNIFWIVFPFLNSWNDRQISMIRIYLFQGKIERIYIYIYIDNVRLDRRYSCIIFS